MDLLQPFRNLLLSFWKGLIILIPLIITVAIISWVLDLLNGFVGLRSSLGKILQSITFIPHVSEWAIVALGYVIVISVIILVGQATMKVEERQEISKKISAFFDRIPGLNRVYRNVEQLWDLTFHRRSKGLAKFGAVVAFKYANVTILGLLASDQKFVLNGVEHVFIFLPSSPLPATGFNYLVPVEDVKYPEISLEEFVKVHLSLGVLSSDVYPKDFGLRDFDMGKKPEIKAEDEKAMAGQEIDEEDLKIVPQKTEEVFE